MDKEKKVIEMKKFLYLCSQLTCKHFFDEFIFLAEEMPIGYIPCPACGCSAEHNGLGGDRLIDRIVIKKPIWVRIIEWLNR